MNYNMNIGLLLDMCGIFYTEEQLTKLEKLVENFIQKILGSNGCKIYENYLQNEDFKEDFLDISLKEELKQDEVNSENKCENTDIVPEEKVQPRKKFHSSNRTNNVSETEYILPPL